MGARGSQNRSNSQQCPRIIEGCILGTAIASCEHRQRVVRQGDGSIGLLISSDSVEIEVETEANSARVAGKYDAAIGCLDQVVPDVKGIADVY
jgi:hypothetical protein